MYLAGGYLGASIREEQGGLGGVFLVLGGSLVGVRGGIVTVIIVVKVAMVPALCT